MKETIKRCDLCGDPADKLLHTPLCRPCFLDINETYGHNNEN